MDTIAFAVDHQTMKHTLIFFTMFAGFALADGKSDAEAAVASAAAACKAQQIGCTVSASYTEMGWLWKNGVPVNNTTVVIKATVPAPKPQAPPAPAPVVIIGSPFLFPLSAVQK